MQIAHKGYFREGKQQRLKQSNRELKLNFETEASVGELSDVKQS